MKATEQLQTDVLDELAYDSAVDSSGVAVTTSMNGVVTLTGVVPTYMQRQAAERAAKRVKRVKAVVNDVEVDPSRAGAARADTDLAQDALRAIRVSASVPKDRVMPTVTKGWITLDGEVEWAHQKRAAVNAVRDLQGVKGVINHITVVPVVRPSEVRTKIQSAFRRAADLDASNVEIETHEGRITLRGNVRSWAEKDAAEYAAWSAPGVESVSNEIVVAEHAYV